MILWIASVGLFLLTTPALQPLLLAGASGS